MTVAAAVVVTRTAPARAARAGRAGPRQFSTAPPSTVSTVPVTKLLSIR